MAVEIVTREDLEFFRQRLLKDLQTAFNDCLPKNTEDLKGYKTADVRKILGCSVNKLISIRISRKLRTKKIGGTLYYNQEDIKKLLEDGF